MAVGSDASAGQVYLSGLQSYYFHGLLGHASGPRQFNFHKEVNGRTLISPCWSFCLSYEFELRKEATRLCNQQSMGVQAALWTALRNAEHRMKHWLQLVAIPNAPFFQRSGDSGVEKEDFSAGNGAI